MIFALINIAFALFMTWLAIFIDAKTGNEGKNPVISLNVFLALSCAAMGLTIFAANGAPDRLTTFFAELTYILFGVYSVSLSVYYIFYPAHEKRLLAQIFSLAGAIWCVWAVFFHFTGVTVTNFVGIRIESISIFSHNLASMFPYNWLQLYSVIIFFILPFFSVLIMLLRAENRDGRLDHQKSVMNACALIAAWIALAFISKASDRVAMFSTLFLLPYVFAQWIIARATLVDYLYDLYSMVGFVLKGIICYIFPALMIGFGFAFLWSRSMYHGPSFYFFLLILLALVVFIAYHLMKVFSRRSGFRSMRYASLFEEDLSKFDFSDDPENIVRNMQQIFIKNIGMSFMRILVDNGNEEIESVYDLPEEKKLTFSVRTKMFDSLLNQNRHIIFKSALDTGYYYVDTKNDISKFFEETDSEAFIILNEGRHILGVIILGQKAGGNVYNTYDLDVFTKLYSYFFVFGYYMKNIGNESIVGVVNREIRMSEQIIESIQGNMDPIRNKRYDSGTMMVHAHNIGGEFIDLIKLSEDRHIFVMGDLSGKGIAASMSMVIVKSVIRTFLQETKDFKLLVEKVNQFIRFNLPRGTFFEGVFALIDFTDNTVYYINCAVPALFLYNRAYNNVMEIQGEGHVLGFVKDISPYIKVKKVKLNPGDVLFACTDGLLDSKSLRGEAFGKDRLQKSIIENTSLPAQGLISSAYNALLDFLSKELDDDVSIFTLKMLKS
ncbi:MAG: serine/threonine-protein phosphatase [Treponema sp.]|uniref:PP2C family protein-serine/threonine phosphatase n=1 Tax=Treponema sp. TaxID=166 RepID=UPI0025ECA8E1|nr:PP2C family protein-serine/threonine phosphatase [Treponema sp.]MBQ9283173.1 serine/threonine-protein phosphatase [Treponema sp.]